MAIPRSAATVLATVTFLAAAPVAEAQSSWSTTPPTSGATPVATPASGHSAGAGQSPTLPLTGMDSTLELVLATALLCGGAAVRLGTATPRE